MATATSMRLPWRAIARSITTRPTTQSIKAPPAASIPQPFTRRWASDSASNTAIGSEFASAGLERAAAAEIEGTARRAGVDAESPNASTITTTPPSESSPTEPLEQPHRNTVNPDMVRPPRAVQAAYLRPLRRPATHGLPVCDLQLRSYSVRNLEFFADFCLRAAYYLGLPAFGPIPLPRIVERWTVPKGSFIHKKSQENFERKTLRRLIQIKDGEPETVEVWLAFVKKYAYYGIGMKANVWEFEKVGVGRTMDAEMEQMRSEVEPTLRQFAFKKGSAVEDKVLELINRGDFKAASGGNAPMIRTPTYKLPKN